jgi:hypothetical protein
MGLAFLSQKHDNFANFSMQLGEPDWRTEDMLDFGGNVGDIVKSSEGKAGV